MSFYTQQTLIVPIDGENNVTIRALTYGEEQAIKQQSMRISARMRGGREGSQEGEAVVDAVKMQVLTLHQSIVAWEGPGFEGRDVSPENIDALPSWVTDKIVEGINELDAPLTADEKNV